MAPRNSMEHGAPLFSAATSWVISTLFFYPSLLQIQAEWGLGWGECPPYSLQNCMIILKIFKQNSLKKEGNSDICYNMDEA